MKFPPILFCIALAACGGDPQLFTSPVVTPTEKVSVSYRSVSVLDVSLPGYAAGEEIAIVSPEGGLAPSTDTLWADDPERATTLALSRALTQITGRQIAPEPWPFQSRPDAIVDVRVEEMLADGVGTFRMSGQYFVAPDNPDRREIARLFSFAVPYVAEGGLPAVAQARSSAIVQLAELVAREGLR